VTVVSAHHLGKRYPGAGAGDRWALRGVGFELPRGEALAVVGENGSGKSTLLDLLMGVTSSSEGEVRIAGKRVSLVDPGAGFFAELTGRENAMQSALLSGLGGKEAQARVAEVREIAELGEHFEQPLRTYSAGMAMRLGFAVAAAATEADVVIVDEVLAVGDGYFQRRCIDRLRERRARGTTLVIASHDLHALRGLCDRALWLRGGRAERLGAAAEVLEAYEEHLRRRAEETRGPAPGRQGTGEVSVLDVRLANEAGTTISELPEGGTLRVEVDFEALQSIEAPVMGVAIFRDDGVYCYGPNTRGEDRLAGTYRGRYRLTALFERLALLPGSYEVSVAFYDRDHVYAYAWHHRLYPFRIAGAREEHGVVRLAHRFLVEKVNGA
jgi:lipopolysaccharide transport system ATP-binding protein